MSKKRVILSIIIAVLVLALVYFLFFYIKKCGDQECFTSAQIKCARASYINDAEEATWGYEIKGKKAGRCIINVKLLQVKQGTIKLEKVGGLEMSCSIPLGYVGSPQADLSQCHGLLKEELQELMIQKMHAYILTNLGQISDELKSAL